MSSARRRLGKRGRKLHEYRRLLFAGFLPLWKDEATDTWWMLLGKESDGWGAFGGGPEAGEHGDYTLTACREAREESHGVLSPQALHRASSVCAPLISTSKAEVYGIVVPPKVSLVMNDIFYQLRSYKPRNGCFEKRKVKWFRLDALTVRASSAKEIGNGIRLRAALPIDVNEEDTLTKLECIRKDYRSKDWSSREMIKRVAFENLKCEVHLA